MNLNKLGRLQSASTTFLLCDIQEIFRNKIHHFPSVISSTQTLLSCMNTLQIPTIVTTQYAKAFGNIVSELDLKEQYKVTQFDKTLFSMCTEEVNAQLKSNQTKSVILCGIEVS